MPLMSFGEYEGDELILNTDHIVDIFRKTTTDANGGEETRTIVRMTNGNEWRVGLMPSEILRCAQELTETWSEKQAKQNFAVAEEISNRTM